MEGGLIAPSLQNMSNLLLQSIGRKDNLHNLNDEELNALMQFAKKCTIGAAFDKVRLMKMNAYASSPNYFFTVGHV